MSASDFEHPAQVVLIRDGVVDAVVRVVLIGHGNQHLPANGSTGFSVDLTISSTAKSLPVFMAAAGYNTSGSIPGFPDKVRRVELEIISGNIRASVSGTHDGSPGIGNGILSGAPIPTTSTGDLFETGDKLVSGW